jgi:hypothetical protein
MAASGTSAGCRLARQLLIKLGNDPGRLERGYIAVADSGTQQLVTFRRGSLYSTHGFAPFRQAAGIPRGSHVTIAACHDNPEHLHFALAAAPSAPQQSDAERAAAAPVPSAPPPEKRSCIGVLMFVLVSFGDVLLHDLHGTDVQMARSAS